MPYDSHTNIREHTNIKDMEFIWYIYRLILGAERKTQFFLPSEQKNRLKSINLNLSISLNTPWSLESFLLGFMQI